MKTLTKPVHGGYYQGGVEVTENGVKNTEWCGMIRERKTEALDDAVKLMSQMEGEDEKI
jgi:hypothetical protein